MIALWAMLTLATAQEGEPADVRQPLAAGAVINWTTLVLEVEATGRGGATESNRAVEELARRDADAGVRQGVPRIQVSFDRTVGDLQRVPEFSGALKARSARWWAAETRYHTSGRVEVDARLSLHELLKPYTLATAKPYEAGDEPQPRFTGVVVDARGTQAEPAWSPGILSATGEVLYEGVVWEEVAVEVAPVIYVSDPAHPAAARAGDDPIFLRADGAEGARVVLTPEDSQRFRTTLGHARLLGEGKLVIVVDAL